MSAAITQRVPQVLGGFGTKTGGQKGTELPQKIDRGRETVRGLRGSTSQRANPSRWQAGPMEIAGRWGDGVAAVTG